MKEWLQLVKQQKAIAIIRCSNYDLAYQMALSAAEGGIKIIEITWNCDHPAKLITHLRAQLPDCSIGAGTILNPEQLRLAMEAGAEFAFAPHLDLKLLEFSLNSQEIAFIPGVFTPSEAIAAWQQGALAVKVFPIKSLGGAEYIRCLQGPLPQISMIPTGGITLENASSMIKAGAIAVGISSSLFPKEIVLAKDWSAITMRTKYLLKQLRAT